MKNSPLSRNLIDEAAIKNSASLFYIFLGDEYIGIDCFSKEKISIGSSDIADITLPDEDIAGIQAVCSINNEIVTVTDEANNGKVFLNTKSVVSAELGTFDFITIGQYIIKIKVKMKKEHSAISAPVVEDILVKIGAVTKEQRDKDFNDFVDTVESVEFTEPVEPEEDAPVMMDEFPDIEEEDYYEEEDEEEDDDEEDEDEEAPFLLRDKLVVENKIVSKSNKKEKSIEIIKFNKNTVVDVSFLNAKEKYYCTSNSKKFCLAENKNSTNSYVYFNDNFEGKVRFNDSGRSDPLCDDRNRTGKKQLRQLIPKNADVLINDGYYDYLIRKADQVDIPFIPDVPKEKTYLRKRFLHSAALHVLVIVVIGIFNLINKPVPTLQKDESRFVTIEMEKLIPKPKKPKLVKKVELEPVKPKPKKKMKPKKVVKKKRKTPTKKVKRKSKKRNKVYAAKSKSKTGSGGGGPGKKGNIKNKNISQTGILAALGIPDGIGIQASEALAAVTNLDAVTTVNAVEGSFKVGGIIGKLGTPGISVSRGGVITTKGSSQVMRTGGNGDNRLAALSNGAAGQGNIKGSVSVKLNKSVRIRGGMSREAVKRVIDQHMSEITFCYETELLKNPSLMGKIIFEWGIDLSGRVGETRIQFSSINSGGIHSCIKSAIQSWQFPKPTGSSVVVSYPFVFDVVGF